MAGEGAGLATPLTAGPQEINGLMITRRAIDIPNGIFVERVPRGSGRVMFFMVYFGGLLFPRVGCLAYGSRVYENREFVNLG